MLAALAHSCREFLAALARAWSLFWFQPYPTTPLEIVRIGVGGAVLFHYAMATPFLFDFWGDAGWVPREVALEYLAGPWTQSVHFYFSEPWHWTAFHAVFLFCACAFVVGWRTSWVKWIVLIGHISYDHRNVTISYGAESITACLLFILCLAPVGRAISLDRVRAVRAAKRSELGATLPAFVSPWAGACTRLVQIQMAVLFFYSGIEKIRGDDWWNGDAIWLAATTNEFYSGTLVALIAHQYWLVTVGTYATILIEIAYIFLIWQRRTRPYLLALAILLHVSFGVFLALVYFSFIMVMGHMSFLRPEWLERLGAWWKGKVGDMEMIYDGRCGFCVRSMASLLAFDGLGQIAIRDFRTNPSPLVSDAQMEKALYLILPGGRALPGFEAYRYVVPRVPGLWWLVPFFYIPVLSRLFGHPIYNWVAANRGRLSSIRPGRLAARWRTHLIYLVMSLVVAWHTFAIVVGPNNSATAQSFRGVLQPYLSLLRLESTWSFFAPNVGRNSQFRYVIEDAAGNKHTFVPGGELSWYLPTDIWFKNWYYAIIESPETHGDFFAALFCRKHASLKPVAVTLLGIQEQEFRPEDHLSGKRPLDPEFIKVDTLKRVACPPEADKPE